MERGLKAIVALAEDNANGTQLFELGVCKGVSNLGLVNCMVFVFQKDISRVQNYKECLQT